MKFEFILIVIAYVLVMLGIGWWSMRRTKNVGDFFLGGRTLGPWMSAFAFGTTYFSAVLFIGYAGKLGWGFGLHTMWIVVGNTIIGTLLSWWLLAGRTREMTARLNAMTMPEFLRARYGSKAMQVIGALVVFLFLVPYSASVYMGLSYLFEKVLGMPYGAALIFLAVLTGVYLIMGGYFAVAISDFVRGIVEFGGVLLMVFLLAQMKGGFAATTSALLSNPEKTSPGMIGLVNLGDGAWHIVVPGSFILLSLVLITSFGPWSLPQMVQKFYSIRSKADVKRAMIIASVFALFMSFGAYYSGALTHLFYPSAADLAPIIDAATHKPNLDMLMPHFITTFVPIWLVLVILLLVFSASMSSLSSLVLVSSSAISIDIYGAFVSQRMQHVVLTIVRVFFGLCSVLAFEFMIFMLLRIFGLQMGSVITLYPIFFILPYAWEVTTQTYFAGAQSLLTNLLGLCSAIYLTIACYRWIRLTTEGMSLALMRIFCAVFVALSLWIAMSKVDVIVNLMVMSWGSLAGVFLAPYLYGLFWKRTTKAGAFAGIIAGLLCAFTLFSVWGPPGVPLAGAITMFLPMIVVPVVSWLTPPPPKALVDAAFGDAEPAPVGVKEGVTA